jgi:hypothetical protein
VAFVSQPGTARTGTCLRICFTVLALYFFVSVSVFAADEDTDAATVERQLEAEREVAGLVEEAEARKAVEGLERVEYADVLDDPDNLMLNFKYAKQQIADGNLLGASGTLERILMVNADLHAVRLYYALTLYRLENLSESERELNLLLSLDIPDDLRERIETNLAKIRRRRQTLRFTLRQNIGYGIDDNQNAASSSKTSVASDVATGLEGTSRRRRDTNFLIVNTLDVNYKPGFQEGHEVFGSVSHFIQEQTQLDTLDLQSFRGEIGGVLKSNYFDTTPSVYLSHLFLSRESFLRTQGASVTIERDFERGWSGESTISLERQDYMNISDNTSGQERKGPQFEWDIAAHYLIRPNMRMSAKMGYTYKNAEERSNTTDTIAFKLTHLWLLGHGQFLVQSVDTEFEYHNEPDFAVAATSRKDKTLRYKITYSAPLTFLKIGNYLPKPAKDINVALTYEFYRASSSITNFTYRNHKVQALFTKVWKF